MTGGVLSSVGREARIAIIGAGPAGLHMAAELKKRGYHRIVIYERTSRVGGKTLSVMHNHVNQELGTTGFSISDKSGLNDFMREVFPDLDERTYIADIMTLQRHSLIGRRVQKSWLRSTQKYWRIILNRRRFYAVLKRLEAKGYPYNIHPEDTRTLHEMSESMLQFMTKNNLLFLYKSLRNRFIAYGYGNLDNIPAYYGILLLERNYMSKTVYRIFRDGNDTLWKATVDKHGLNVKLNHQVRELDYTRYASSRIVGVRTWHNGREKLEEFDHVMVTAPHQMCHQLPDAARTWFQQTQSVRYVTSLVSLPTRDHADQHYVAEYPLRSNTRLNFDVAMMANFGKMKNISGLHSNSNMDAQVSFQVSDRPGDIRDADLDAIRDKLVQDIRHNFDRASWSGQVHQQQVWQHYFPHFSSRAIQRGALQAIHQLQGEYGTWYLGSVVAGELVSLVMEHNHHLLTQVES